MIGQCWTMSAVGKSEIYVSREVSKTLEHHISLMPSLRRLLRGHSASGCVPPANWRRMCRRLRTAMGGMTGKQEITRQSFALPTLPSILLSVAVWRGTGTRAPPSFTSPQRSARSSTPPTPSSSKLVCLTITNTNPQKIIFTKLLTLVVLRAGRRSWHTWCGCG